MSWSVAVEEVVKSKLYKASFYNESNEFISEFEFEASSIDEAERIIKEIALKKKG